MKKDFECDYNQTSRLFEEFCNYTSEKKDLLQEFFKFLRKDYTVLDIGAGTGSLTIPIAKVVKNVIAIDVSSEALNYLKAKARKENLKNIRVINKRWEEIDKLPPVDVVTCVHVIYFFDNWHYAIKKMLDVAKKSLIIVVHHNESEFYKFLNMFWPKVNDFPFPKSHNHLYICRLLKGMSVKPKIKFVRSTILIPEIKKALELCPFFFENQTIEPDVKRMLLDYFTKKLTPDGKVRINTQNAIIIVQKTK